MISRFNVYLVIFLVWIVFLQPVLSISENDLRNKIKFDKQGRILSVNYSDRAHHYAKKGDPIQVEHEELVKVILRFAKNRSKTAINRVLGNPRHIENKAQKLFDMDPTCDEIWLYTCGPARCAKKMGFGFHREKCIAAYTLSNNQINNYIDWKIASFKAEAIGMTASAVLKRFGEPGYREKLKGIVLPFISKKKLDQEWRYMFLDSTGVSLWFTNNKCHAISVFETLY